MNMRPNKICKVLLDLKGRKIVLSKPLNYGIVNIEKNQQFDIVADKLKDMDSDDKLILSCEDNDMYKTVSPG